MHSNALPLFSLCREMRRASCPGAGRSARARASERAHVIRAVISRTPCVRHHPSSTSLYYCTLALTTQNSTNFNTKLVRASLQLNSSLTLTITLTLELKFFIVHNSRIKELLSTKVERTSSCYSKGRWLSH